MSEAVDSGRALEVSVSFGKFENDSLSWEKWSSFSPNKYMEEAEKCSTPGSVAQKKAYFEAHYKKIAAKKMDQIEMEKQMELDPSRSEESKQETLAENGSGSLNGDRSEGEVEHETNAICQENSETVSESKDVPAAAAIDTECNSSYVEEAKEEQICNDEKPEISERDDIVEVEETPQKKPEDVEPKLKADNDTAKSSAEKDKNLKGHSKGSDRKIHPSSNDQTYAGTRKSLTSPALKSSKVSPVPRSSPAPTPKVVSRSVPQTKKANGSPMQKIKNTPMTENKKPAPRSPVSLQSSSKIQNGSSLQRSKNSPITDNKRLTRSSLHMSLSLSPANSAASQNMLRKSVMTETESANSMATHGTIMGRSLIMDRMADKDIVRRAFKSFRNSLSEVKSSGDKSHSGPEQMTSKGPEQKISTSITSRGENGRFGKSEQRVTTQKGQSGTKSNPVPSRTPIGAGVERRKTIATKQSAGLTNGATNKISKEGAKSKTNRPIK